MLDCCGLSESSLMEDFSVEGDWRKEEEPSNMS